MTGSPEGLTAAAVMAEACQQTGLDDFGAPSFLEGLDVYCTSASAEASLNGLGQVAVRANVVGSLANRLRVVDWAARHPDVADEQIVAPVFVIGMFRAGTTFLSNLLERDPANRALLRWESADSVPPPTPENHHVGPRVEAARAGLEMIEAINPKLAAVHHEEADGPTECITLMGQEFKSLVWEAISNVPAYGQWLLAADQASAYEYHHLALQVLQHGGVRGRWTLKSPHHAIALDALTDRYPDAHLVLLHRDPVVLCASVCSLITTLSGTFTDVDHTAYVRSHWTALLAESVRRIEAFRQAHPEHPVIDVQYADLVEQPVTTVASIYDAVGTPLAETARAAMEAYVASSRRRPFGEHHYGLAEFGLDADDLAERFGDYAARYDIPSERSAG